MTPSARAARPAIAAASLLCIAAFVAACGSNSTNSAGGQSSASPSGSSSPASASASPRTSTVPASPTSSSPASGSPASCTTSGLKITINASGGGAAAGSAFFPINLKNTGSSACTVFGYPGVSFVSSPGGSQIGQPAKRNNAVTPAPVTLGPGATAHVTLQVVDALNYSKSTCQPVKAHWLRIYPPNQFTAADVKFTALVCARKLPAKVGTSLTVTAAKSGVGKPGQGL